MKIRDLWNSPGLTSLEGAPEYIGFGNNSICYLKKDQNIRNGERIEILHDGKMVLKVINRSSTKFPYNIVDFKQFDDWADQNGFDLYQRM